MAPATLIVGDSVLNGSDGPGLYPAAHVTADPEQWNRMPIVVRHPTKVVDGQLQNISARDPEVINAWGIGDFYRSKVQNGKDQAGEMWFDVLNVKTVDAKLVKNGSQPIWPHLEKRLPLELSTGLRPHKRRQSGVTSNGQQYSWIAEQPYNPDHVAVFPPGEERGACSVADGCGVNNQANEKRTLWQKLGAMLGLTNEATLPAQANEPVNSAKCPECGGQMTLNAETGEMTCNVCGAKMKTEPTTNDHLPWDECIAKGLKEYGSQKHAEELCGAIKAGTANDSTTTNKETDMPLTKQQRAQIVNQLTTNCKCKIKPEVLNELDDEALSEVHNSAKLTLVVNAYKAGQLGATRNADGEGEAVPGVPWPQLAKTLGIDIDPRTDPVGFTGAMKKALDAASGKLGGASPPAPADSPTTAAEADPMEPDADDKEMPMTGNKKLPIINEAQLPPELRADLEDVRNARRQEKETIVRELIQDLPVANRKAAGDAYWKMALPDLRAMRPQRQVQNAKHNQAPDWSLAGGSNDFTANEGGEADDETVRLMTVNCGVGQQVKHTA